MKKFIIQIALGLLAFAILSLSFQLQNYTGIYLLTCIFYSICAVLLKNESMINSIYFLLPVASIITYVGLFLNTKLFPNIFPTVVILAILGYFITWLALNSVKQKKIG